MSHSGNLETSHLGPLRRSNKEWDVGDDITGHEQERIESG